MNNDISFIFMALVSGTSYKRPNKRPSTVTEAFFIPKVPNFPLVLFFLLPEECPLKQVCWLPVPLVFLHLTMSLFSL